MDVPHGTIASMGFLNFKSRNTDDKRRLEAFMSALPFEYCGWNGQGITVWSRDFPKLFGLASIQHVRDIQSAILPSDAAALEGMIFTLKKDHEPFSLSVKTNENQKIITLHGMSGQDLDGIESYDVLWAEDTTLKQNDADELSENLQKLQKDIHQYRVLLDHLPQSIWATNEDSEILYSNKKYTNMVGDNGQFNPILSQAQKISVAEMANNAMDAGEPDHSTGRVIVNGKRKLMDIHVIPDTQEKFVVHSAYDITQQEELRAELKRYVSANAGLMEQLSTAIGIFTADHKLEFYNPAFAALWGLEDAWLNGQPVLGDILEKLREMRRLPEQANFKDYKKSWLDMFTGLLESEQFMMYLPDGVAVRLMVVPHPMGGLMMTFEDVTSRLELESSFNTLIAVQKETLDNLGEGVAVFGSDGRLQLYNPSYLKKWALNPEFVETKPHISEIVEKKKRFFKGDHIKWDVIKSRLMSHAIDRENNNESIIRSDGSVLECSAVSLPDGGVMVTYRDVTDSRKVQDALEEKNQALTDAEKLKTDFLANVSYQLRTPLNAISGFSEILNHEYFGEINDKHREYTQGITDAATRLASLIDDILDLSSIEAGYLRLDKDEIDIKSMMDDIYELTRDWAGMETLKIKYTKPKGKFAPMTLDARRMKQAVINIIRNAINYTPSGGLITLKLDQDDNNVILTVSDTGIGIGEDDKDAIFEPFKTITSAEEGAQRPNTGLGLSLAKNIIAMHDGDINVESKLGEGTMVTITLPKD